MIFSQKWTAKIGRYVKQSTTSPLKSWKRSLTSRRLGVYTFLTSMCLKESLSKVPVQSNWQNMGVYLSNHKPAPPWKLAYQSMQLMKQQAAAKSRKQSAVCTNNWQIGIIVIQTVVRIQYSTFDHWNSKFPRRSYRGKRVKITNLNDVGVASLVKSTSSFVNMESRYGLEKVMCCRLSLAETWRASNCPPTSLHLRIKFI